MYPVPINFVYINFIVISIFRGIDAAIMNPSFHSITYFVSKYSIFMWFHCVILWTGAFRSRACAMLCIWNLYFVGGPFFLNTIVHSISLWIFLLWTLHILYIVLRTNLSGHLSGGNFDFQSNLIGFHSRWRFNCGRSVYHNVVYHLTSSSAANLLPVYHSF